MSAVVSVYRELFGTAIVTQLLPVASQRSHP
jgi:hypothetical protein